MKRLCAVLLSCFLMSAPVTPQSVPPPEQNECQDTTNSLNYVAYLRSRPMDHQDCAMRVQNGRIVIDPMVTNPAMSCSDMFAWKLYAEVITQEFWKNWAPDQYTWPNQNPLPLCSTGVTPCCTPGSLTNPGYANKDNPATQCPYFPGDFPGTPQPVPYGAPPSKAHLPSFMQLPSVRDRVAGNLEVPDPGRVVRQSMAEIVYRNEPMFDYIFRNDIYHQNGIAEVYTRNNDNLNSATPYRLKNPTAQLSEIDLPIASIMIKSNWLNRKRAEELGIKEDPRNPFIKMMIRSAVTDNNGTILEPGEHWLVAFHISSKDTPNWTWLTFEHVTNMGRCDYTGCNDSYGFSSPDNVGANQVANYTVPKTVCDDLLLPSWVFDLGKIYDGGTISAGLKAVLDGLNIGVADNSTMNPTPRDRGWRSYRLKGSQNNFVDSMGQKTHLGNSVTEGGFMITSSCITCHSRAATTSKGTIPLALGVFINETDDQGYLQSARGTPDPDWFFASNQPPSMLALQTDFVWGFLSANACKTCPPPAVAAEPEAMEKPAPSTLRSRIRTDGQKRH